MFLTGLDLVFGWCCYWKYWNGKIVSPAIPVWRSIETQTPIRKVATQKVRNRKWIIGKKIKTVESELLEPNEINLLKVKMLFKDKVTNTNYFCFNAKVNEHQNESEWSTSGENVADNDTSFHMPISGNDTHTTESECTNDCDEFGTKPNNLSDETKIIVTWSTLKVSLFLPLV